MWWLTAFNTLSINQSAVNNASYNSVAAVLAMTSRELLHAIALHDRPLGPLSTPVTPIYNDSAAEALTVMINAYKIDSKMRFEISSVRLHVEYVDYSILRSIFVIIH